MPDQEYFVELIKENQGILYKISSLYTNNEADRQDLRQEMIYQLWRSFDSFSGKSKISTWIYRVALNTALLFVKKDKRKGTAITLDEGQLPLIDTVDNVMEERIKLLYKTIRKLTDVERAIILLYLEGKKYEEIAEITGFTPTNIGTRIGRIKIKLKSQIKHS